MINKLRALCAWYSKGFENGSHLRVSVNQAASVQERGDATGAVPALLDLVAVGVEDAIEDRGAGPPRRLENERLIEADAGAARGEQPETVGLEERIRGRIEDREVVADTVHLGERDAHQPGRIPKNHRG